MSIEAAAKMMAEEAGLRLNDDMHDYHCWDHLIEEEEMTEDEWRQVGERYVFRVTVEPKVRRDAALPTPPTTTDTEEPDHG